MGFATGLERNNVLSSMPLPVLDISDSLKAHGIVEVQQVIDQISASLARNQSPKFSVSLNDGMNQNLALLVDTQYSALLSGF